MKRMKTTIAILSVACLAHSAFFAAESEPDNERVAHILGVAEGHIKIPYRDTSLRRDNRVKDLLRG